MHVGALLEKKDAVTPGTLV